MAIALCDITQQAAVPRATSPTHCVTGYTYSGASWLLNCMVELGIYTDYNPPSIFGFAKAIDASHSEYEITSHSSRPAKHYMPALTFKDKFIFRNDIYFCHLGHQVFPKNMSEKSKVVVMIRDPRDAIWSQWSSGPPPGQTFDQVVRQTGLAEAWRYFNMTWLGYSQVTFVKFEDMKLDPILQLKNILKFFNLTYPDTAIEQAVANSTSERSRAAEMILRENTPPEEHHFKIIFNRSGKTEQWKHLAEHQETFKHIQNHNQVLMRAFNYR